MRNVTVVLDQAGNVIDQGRVMASQIHGITLATDNNQIRDYRSTDGYELLFAGPEDRTTDYRPQGGFVMHMVNERTWRAAGTAAEVLPAVAR